MAIQARLALGQQSFVHALNSTISVATSETLTAGDIILIICTGEGENYADVFDVSGATNLPGVWESQTDVINKGGYHAETAAGVTTHTVSNPQTSGPDDNSADVGTDWWDMGFTAGGFYGDPSAQIGTIGRNHCGAWAKVLTSADDLSADKQYTCTVEMIRRLSAQMIIISGASITSADLTIAQNIAMTGMNATRTIYTDPGTYPQYEWFPPTDTTNYSSSSGKLDGNFMALFLGVGPPDNEPQPESAPEVGSTHLTDPDFGGGGGLGTPLGDWIPTPAGTARDWGGDSAGGSTATGGSTHGKFVWWETFSAFSTLDNKWNGGFNNDRIGLQRASGYGYNTHTIIFKEATAGGTDHPLPVTDSSTASDTLTLTKASTETKTDTATTSDTLSASKAATETNTDSSTASDTLTTQKAATESNTDSSTASDTLATTRAATQASTDSSTAADTLTAVKSASISITDSATASDVYTDTEANVLTETDSATAADTLAATKAVTETKTDTSTASDTLVATKTSAKTFTETDSSTASDTLAAAKSVTLSVTDSATASDVYTDTEANVLTETDTATTSDTLVTQKDSTLSVTDSATSSDTLVGTKGSAVTLTDSSTASDSLDAVRAGSSTFTETDSSTTSDTLSATKSVALTLTDSVTASDTYVDTEANVLTETDSATAADTLSVTKSVSLTFTDSATASDIYTDTEANTLSETDSSTASDTLLADVAKNAVHTDSSTASDTLDITVSRTISITDSATALDIPSLHKAVDQFFPFPIPGYDTDDTETSDSLVATRGASHTETDSSSTSDTLITFIGVNQSFIDSASSGDSIDSSHGNVVIFTDISSVSDTVSAVGPTVQEIEVVISGFAGVVSELLTEVDALAVLDVWNTALNTLGISTLTTVEGSTPQQTLLSNVFPLFRQQFLSDHMWNGAKKTAKLIKLTTTETENPALGRWDYAWDLPDNALRIWRLNGLENRPKHIGGNANIDINRWEIEIITISSTNYRALLTNESEATIEYIADINDAGVALLGPSTQHAMGMALAVYVATNFGKSASEIAQLDAMAKEAITAAKGIDGQEGTPQMFGNTSLLGVRYIGN